MPARPKPKLASALSEAQIKQRVDELKLYNSDAATALQQHFGGDRWQRIKDMAWAGGVDDAQLTALCGKMMRTRSEWHPGNLAAALHAAACGLLIALGGHPIPEDVTAFEAATKAKD